MHNALAPTWSHRRASAEEQPSKRKNVAGETVRQHHKKGFKAVEELVHMGVKRVVRVADEVVIGAAIRSARARCGMTQAGLAAALGVSYQQIQNYEKGSVRVAASTLRAISIILNTPISSFFEDDDGGVVSH